MECPKCKAHNADDAACCSLCYETFKAKPKSAGGGPMMAFGSAATSFEGWVVTGPLVITEKAFYFFIKDIDKLEGGAYGEKIGSRLGGEFGLVGGILGGVAGAMVDQAAEGEPQYRPGKVVYEQTSGIVDQCQKVLGDAPDIVSCREYFAFQKSEMQELAMGFLGGLSVKTRYLTLEVAGIDATDKLSGFLSMRGYPLQK